MPQYEGDDYSPPAPIARVTVRAAGHTDAISDVPLLIDSGADVSLLPADVVNTLGIERLDSELFQLQAFDGTLSFAEAVVADVILCRKVFRGRFLVTSDSNGVLGRDILNHLCVSRMALS